MTGFWGPPGTSAPDETSAIPVRPLSIPNEDSPADYLSKYKQKSPSDYYYSWPLTSSSSSLATPASNSSTSVNALWVLGSSLFGAIVGGLVTYLIARRKFGRHQYLPIN